MKNLSFKYKIFLGIAFVVVLYAISSIIIINLYMTKVLHEESVEDGRAFAKVVAENIPHLAETSNLSALDAYLRHFKEINPEISYILIQKGDKVIVHTFKDRVPEKLIALRHAQQGIDSKTITLDNDTYSDFSAPLGASLGTLRIGISERKDTETVEHVIFLLACITLVILAASLGISILVARRLTRSLTILSSVASNIANKGFSGSVDISSKDEIGQLGTAFNKMIQTVREREGDLRDINHELETVNVTLHDYIEKLRTTTDELIKTKQDTAVVDTARSFLHHVRQPLTYLIMAIELFSNEIRNSSELDISSLQKTLKTIEDASQKLSGLLIKFDNLKEYKVIHFDDVTKITDIGE